MRLRSIHSAGIALALLAIGDAGAQTAMFRGGPDHTGVYASPAPSLETLVWKFRTGGRVISSPLVVGDAVYVGSADGSLYAIDRATGTQRWKFDTRGPVNSSPAYHNGTVYVGSVDGNVYAVDATSGAVKWTFATKGERRFTAPGIHGAIPRTEREPDPFDVFLSSPAIATGIVYIGSGDQHVYALDAATGALRWSFATGDVVHASPAVANGVVYIGSWDRHLYAGAPTGTSTRCARRGGCSGMGRQASDGITRRLRLASPSRPARSCAARTAPACQEWQYIRCDKSSVGILNADGSGFHGALHGSSVTIDVVQDRQTERQDALVTF